MRITTWNVNGLRARLTHVVDFLREHRPDVLCLQETKVEDAAFPVGPLEDEGYNVEWFGQKSYNGVAILAAGPIEDVQRGLPDDPADAERRVIGATVAGFRVLDLYVPNGQEVGGDKYRFKLDWLRRLRAFLDASYAANEPVVVVGDFNITFDDRDVHDPEWWRERILCSNAERQALRNVMAFGLADGFRAHHAEGGVFTWWHYTAGAAFKDDGLRIDHVLLSPPALARCTDVIVHKELRLQKTPSDHVPVSALFDEPRDEERR
ncbi:MAG: exodeoxyribonuclease III [Planctomycetes bacterium]|nr:exodeoxyribonuclease III [Planctomycetota bacterium]